MVLKLVEDNMLSLDDPVSKYLPTYPNVDGKITIRQLLNHTSGVLNVFEHPDFPWVGTDVDYSKEWKEEEVLMLSCSIHMAHQAMLNITPVRTTCL